MSWKSIVFGGAGPRINAERHNAIGQVTELLNLWRDFDNPVYALQAIDLIKENLK